MNDLSRRLFHLVPDSVWRARPTGSALASPTLAAEGFVHLSHAEQLAGTLHHHFASNAEVVLLELDATRVRAALRLEPSRDGALFPHLYRPIAAEDVIGCWRLMRREDGTWNLPRLTTNF